MRLDIVTPERQLVSAEATEVRIPGSEGDMTIMPNHAPVITTLRPGVLTAVTTDGTHDFIVTGGFAEVNADSTSVLAENAVPVADANADIIDAYVVEAEAAVAAAGEDTRDAAAKLLADMVALKATVA